MFNPDEWTKRAMKIQGKSKIVYINEHTGLAKLRVTFTKEQQDALDRKRMDFVQPFNNSFTE
ncbi:hypothetical protein KP806_19355 [Paenibacillus sp. N4]|uniref:hypothetical protein n=1 Tax=Paenibacillus vietnamensis TaxID=2590547 RepID=UPI001CD057E8|nr:hypothetical protein [Paenibacillus vietnamensis]MCA0757225.1 hypothetical protein [Paenibacillus vietnamensis]